ncbi:MAG: phosphatase PAP2 family protein [Bdellovibrionaceae bacterium]|nr:phosphatase PAP2 family protein [Pseudobdellovibrionaceae bacterium]
MRKRVSCFLGFLVFFGSVSLFANPKLSKKLTFSASKRNFQSISFKNKIFNKNIFFKQKWKKSWSWKRVKKSSIAPYIYTPDKWKWQALTLVSLFAGRSLISPKIQKHFQEHQVISKNVENYGNQFGENTAALLYVAAYYAHSYWFQSNSSFNKAQFYLENILAAGVFTQVAKTISHQQRPDGADYRSFPSGHAGRAFTLAAAISFTHPWYVGVLANIAATGTALARIQGNRHYLHDVTAAALVSYSYAYALYKRNTAKYTKHKRTGLKPDSIFIGFNQLNFIWTF